MREELQAARRRILDRLALAGAPVEQYRHQREMGFDLARLVMADAVDHFEHGDGLGGDAGLFPEFARGAFMDGLAQLDEAAGKAPLSDARRHRALRQEDAAAAPHHGEAADDRAFGIEPVAARHGSVGAARPSTTL